MKLLASLEARVRELHPVLKDIRFTHRWGGPILFRESWEPVFDWHPRSRNAIVLGVFAGHGVMLSSYLGDGRRGFPGPAGIAVLGKAWRLGFVGLLLSFLASGGYCFEIAGCFCFCGLHLRFEEQFGLANRSCLANRIIRPNEPILSPHPLCAPCLCWF